MDDKKYSFREEGNALQAIGVLKQVKENREKRKHTKIH